MSRRGSFAIVLIGAAMLSGAALLGFGRPTRDVKVESADPAKAHPGYTLFAPNFSTTTFLVDMEGRVVHRFKSDFEPGQSAYLLENGHLLRTGCVGPANRTFRGGGAGGRVQEFTWDGELVWDFELSTDEVLLHHDIKRLPNGNVLMIAWERKTPAQCLAAGRHKVLVGSGDLWSDFVVEVAPTGPKSGRIVWEWHVFDHLAQERDPSGPNYGKLSERPERIDANHRTWAEQTPDKDWDQLRGLGYLAGSSPRRQNPDWLHTNSIDYDPKSDRILLSVLGFNEIWIIDHSTTTAEAKGSTGGRAGKGGDLLWRWGNPQTYGLGTEADRKLFAQHDASFVPEGCPGAGHVLVFNNGRGRPGTAASSVEELVPPLDDSGGYRREPGRPFGPEEPAWTYAKPGEFYSDHISGAQRLPNGNTLVCSGDQGWIFEVTPAGNLAWSFKYDPAGDPDAHGPPRGPPPTGAGGPPGDGGPPPGPGGPPGNPACLFRAYRYAFSHPAFAGKNLAVPGTADKDAERSE